MKKFEYEKWIVENKYGKNNPHYGSLNEQNASGFTCPEGTTQNPGGSVYYNVCSQSMFPNEEVFIQACCSASVDPSIDVTICDENGIATTVAITSDMEFGTSGDWTQQENVFNNYAESENGLICFCDEELSFYLSPSTNCAVFCTIMSNNNLLPGYIQGESNTLGQQYVQYDGYEVIAVNYGEEMQSNFNNNWCDEIPTGSICDDFEAAIAPQPEADFCEKCATMADAGVDTSTIPNGEYCECCKGDLVKRWTCTATGVKYPGYGPGMVPMGDAIPIGGTCVSSYGTINADWPYATLDECIEEGCAEPANPEGMIAPPDKGNKLKPLEEKLVRDIIRKAIKKRKRK